MNETLKCPHCGKVNKLTKAGKTRKSGLGMIQQWGCKSCGRTTTKPIIVLRDTRGKFKKEKANESTLPNN